MTSAVDLHADEFGPLDVNSWPVVRPIDDLRFELDRRFSWPTRESIGYRRRLGIDVTTIEAHCGACRVLPVQFFPDRSFDMTDQGTVMSAVIEVLDGDGETVLDLVAWPVRRADKFATALHVADALGIGQVEDPASYIGGRPLRVWRTPESWLRNNCSGVVILNEQSAPRWLSAAPGLIAGEDFEHARYLARLLHPYFPARRVVAPLVQRSAA